jgi:hypothetical protein
MRWLRLTLAVTAALAVASCDLFGHSAEVRYRLTVEVVTPHGLRSGSGIWSYKLRPGNIDFKYNPRFRGDAIPIDLPNGQTVFAVLHLREPNETAAPDAPGNLPELTFERRYLPGPAHSWPSEIGSDRMKALDYVRKQMRGKIKLDCDVQANSRSECPLLVRFRDVRDPRSVEAIDPANVAGALGPGYSLAGMYLQITDDPPTHQVGDRLPWERELGEAHLDGTRANSLDSLASSLSVESFKRWDR